ncbi:MAG TPA: flagellar export chaperone FliS [Herbaspirillum sp.]|jgi:flagellar protein FliS|nr:flagellar export chaperone FliS [Herbaspirillum sp.]
MFGSPSRGANAYANVAMETGVAGATPHKLTLMLMEGASIAIVMAIKYMKERNIIEKGRKITQAILIIDNGLRASLNHKVGDGEIAGNLEALYSYMSRTLFSANVSNKPELLEEVHGLLSQIKEAWEAIDPERSNNAANASNAQSFHAGQHFAKI